MKLQGVMTIELTDVNTGEVETVEETNMVTNAVNYILGLNPMGVYFNASDEYDEAFLWNDVLLPICPNMIGGIFLYSEPLEESVENIYPTTAKLPMAYASNDVNATASTIRGSLNLNESKPLDNGYRFVWDFTSSQGNGTIAAVALTSAQGGKNAYGDEHGSSNVFLPLKRVELPGMEQEELANMYSAVEVDFENNVMYNIRFQDSSVIIRKRRLPVFSVGLNDRLNDMTCTLIEEKVITCSTFKFIGSYTPSGKFLDGMDGYWYGFANAGNSSGDASLYWVKIKKDDYSMTEGMWTLSNVAMQAVGSFKIGTYVESACRCAIRNGYLYVPANDLTGIYKINLNNSTDVTLIDFGFTSSGGSMTNSGTNGNNIVLVNDLLMGYDYMITADDRVLPIAGSKRLLYSGTPLFQYKQFLTSWGGNYGTEYHNTYLLMPYLATINNLDSAVVKDTDKTMKITYELTEVIE